MKHLTGFTLIELMLVLAVLALVVGVAVPGYARIATAAHLGTARSELALDLVQSMNRSIGQSDRLVFCPSLDGVSCLDSFDWSKGWIAFTDPDGSRRMGPQSHMASSHGAIDPGLRLVTSTGRRSILFQAGSATVGSNLTFTFCDRRAGMPLEMLVLSNSGRLRREQAVGAEAVAACANGS
jgi:type IV fimbrial biogenesis protein FimT